MKKTLFSNGFTAIAMVVLLLSGCPLFDLVNTNTAPDADAGRDQTVQVDVEVTLDGHDSEDPDGDKLTYSWSFASRPPDSQLTDLDIIGLDQRTAYFTPDVAGIFDIDLTVDDTESSDTDTVRITVNEPAANSPPVADAGADKNVYVGDQVTFDGSNSNDPDGTIQSWSWDFGDDSPAQTGESVENTYSEIGSYPVVLIVTDDRGGTDVDTVFVYVSNKPTNSKPIADAGANISEVVGAEIQFDGSGSSDTDGEIVSFSWDFDDGSAPRSGSSTTHTYAAADTYSVALTVEDDRGDTDTDVTTVTITEEGVNRPPVADADMPPVASIGETVSFDGTPSDDPDGTIVRWEWDFGDGSREKVGQSVDHSFFEPGTYTVQLTVTDNSRDTNTAQFDYRVNAPPQADAGTNKTVMAGTEVTFNGGGSSDPDGEIVSYLWDFGEGSDLQSGAVASHIYDTVGQHTATLTVTDNDEETAEDTVQITVNSPPSADAGEDLQVLVGETVYFDGSGSSDAEGPIRSYTWDLGDGSPNATGATPSHLYGTTGEFTVTLTVEDSSGATASDTATVTVQEVPNQPPIANAGPNVSADVSETVTFSGFQSTDGDGEIVEWLWDFGDGTTGTGQSVDHVYDAENTYTVTLTVTDDDGASSSDTSKATITSGNKPPVADVLVDPVVQLDVISSYDGSLSYDADGEIVSYQWDFGDGTTRDTMKPNHTYTSGGTYTVTLTVTDDVGKTDTTEASVFVNIPPTAEAGPDKTGNIQEDVLFDGSQSTDPDGPIASYTWDFGDSSQSAMGAVAAHKYAQPGEYTARLSVGDENGAYDNDTLTVTIVDPNEPPTAEAGPNMLIETGYPAWFDGSDSLDVDGTIVDWSWDFGDGAAPGEQKSLGHFYQESGQYTATLTVVDDDGAQATDTTTVTVNDPPVADAGPNKSGLVGDELTFDASGSYDPDGTIQEWEWLFGDGSAPETGEVVQHSFDSAGQYAVSLDVADNLGMFGQDQITVTITEANVAPVAEFTVQPDYRYLGDEITFDGSLSSDQDGTIQSWEWDFDDGSTASGETAPHAFTAAGEYTVVLTVTDNEGETGTTSLDITVESPEILVDLSYFYFGPHPLNADSPLVVAVYEMESGFTEAPVGYEIADSGGTYSIDKNNFSPGYDPTKQYGLMVIHDMNGNFAGTPEVEPVDFWAVYKWNGANNVSYDTAVYTTVRPGDTLGVVFSDGNSGDLDIIAY